MEKDDLCIERNKLFDNQYLLLEKISSNGGSADVWLALDKNTVDLQSADTEQNENDGEPLKVVVKIYRPQNLLDIEGEQRFRDEFKIVYNCHHENLLQPTYFSIYKNRPYLVLPYCKSGSTETLIGVIKEPSDIWNYIYDVASGLAYLHGRKPSIIHQDIKPANILINDDGHYAITDFGISAQHGYKRDMLFEEVSGGTTAYMPPERFLEGYEPILESDIWALGATLYELLTGDVPFGAQGGKVQLDNPSVPVIQVPAPREIKKLIYACLDAEPLRRPSASSIAELARNKGNRNPSFRIAIGLVLTVLLSGSLAWWWFKPQPLDSFTILCNSADSLVNIEKGNQSGNDYIQVEAMQNRLVQSELLYQEALQQTTNQVEKLEEIKLRLKKMQEMSVLIERYIGICDTIQIAKEVNLPLQFEEYSEKQRILSDQIKLKISNL